MKFTPNIKGFSEAKKWLKDNGLYTKLAERMDGYSLVFYANDKYRKKKK
jgi:hypothetical protein